jgi:imidazolonepropionase-like amidohydrolase
MNYSQPVQYVLPALIACLLTAPITSNSVAAAEVLAFTGAVIETVSDGRLDNGVIVVRDGIIEAVGDEVKIPETARIIDVSGSVIMPGIIDPYHAISISGATATPVSRTAIINGRRVTLTSPSSSSVSFARVGENFYPFSFRGRVLQRTGVTHINLVASGYGQAALIRNTPKKPESMLIDSDGVMYASISNRSTSINVIRSGLASGARPTSSSSRTGSVSPAQALWKEVREGKRRLIVNANNAAGILHLLELLESHKKIKLTLIATGPNIYRAMDALRRTKPSLIVQPTIDTEPNSTVRICVPRLVNEAGMKMAFSLSFSQSRLTASQDTPLFPVAQMVRVGLPRETALRALTLVPAELLGLEKTHGSISKGKQANLLVFDGDPLDPASQLQRVYVEGNQVYEN